MASLGELLAELRQDKGLTQKELGEILCVSPGTISNYENDVHLPDIEKLTQLADYFHVTADYLLGRTSSSISPDTLQQTVSDKKTLADIMKMFINLPQDRQQALSLIISDLEFNHLINEYSQKGMIENNLK